LVERDGEMKQSMRLLAVMLSVLCASSLHRVYIPSSSRLASLTLEAPNALLSPLRSHPRSSWSTQVSKGIRAIHMSKTLTLVEDKFGG
jgi:hypothetical protein